MSKLFAYADESGNTGLQIFDDNQPYFWTGSLVSATDVDVSGRDYHEHCCHIVESQELHGSILGSKQVERIAGKLRAAFTNLDCHFVFTRIEKRHLATTKFVDTVLDSGANEAVSNIHYGNTAVRLNP